MGGKSGGGGPTDVKTTQEPWAAAQPLLTNLLGDTSTLYGQGGMGPQPWQGIRTAPQSAMTQQSLQGFYDTATQGNPITPQAQQAFSSFMDPQGYGGLDQVKANALGQIMPAAMSRFAGAGMLDSTLAADAAGRAATQAIAPIDYGAWENAQNRKLGAMGQAPALSANTYLDNQMLGMAGAGQDAYMQNVLNSAMGTNQDFTDQQYNELQRAAQMGMGFGGMGGTSNQKNKEDGGGVMGTVGDIMQVAGPLLAMAAFM